MQGDVLRGGQARRWCADRNTTTIMKVLSALGWTLFHTMISITALMLISQRRFIMNGMSERLTIVLDMSLAHKLGALFSYR